MYTTILKLAWPYIMRFVTSQAANYLEQRREQRLSPTIPSDALQDCPPCPPDTTSSQIESQSTSGGSFWFTLSGIYLGGAFFLMVYVLIKKDQIQ